ncbi:MAG: hypothetical protein BWX88_00154 [Planctomycetes bacterium ADurb.Bin126]|nr:MAG: hypothetical protein BWX88_00154 [Planctomycetes bacterium ADurb.Bin126]HQL73048.1 hypothetical protein [Phycisphaerae bacterium]
MAMERTRENLIHHRRREWLRGAARAGCLGALAVLGGWLGARPLPADGGAAQGDRPGAGAACARPHPCAACALAGRCLLPRAQVARGEGRP